MADLRKTCPGCKRRFRPAKGTRRLWCTDCKPSRTLAADEAAPVVLGPGSPGWIPGPIESRALADLTAVDRLDTVEGQLTIRLAREIDGGRLTGAALASLGKQLLESKRQATAGTRAPERDAIDELADARARKAETA